MNGEQQKGDEHHGGNRAGGTRTTPHGRQQPFTAFHPTRALTVNLMEQVCDPQNLLRAYRRVRANKGKPGVDGMTVHQLADWLRENNAALTASLRDGTYQPYPVRGVRIPKPGGGQRQLGIPVVVDRLVQQMILQVLEPIFDPTFSDSSYGFRPGRDAHRALEQARQYVAQEGRQTDVPGPPEKLVWTPGDPGLAKAAIFERRVHQRQVHSAIAHAVNKILCVAAVRARHGVRAVNNSQPWNAHCTFNEFLVCA